MYVCMCVCNTSPYKLRPGLLGGRAAHETRAGPVTNIVY